MGKKIVSLLLAVVLTLGLCACGQKATTETAPTWQEQYDLGVRYLSEGNYEEAIIAFTAAIEIDPKRVDSYLGRANAYMNSETTEDSLALALSDYEMVLSLDEMNADAYLSVAEIYIARGELDKAEEMLRTGLDKTGDARLSARLEDIVGGNISDYWGRPVRESTYDASGTLLYYLEYSYLAGGRFWKYDTAASYDGSGAQTGYVKCEYDEDGKLVRGFNQINHVICPSINTYDDNGDMIRSDAYDEDGSPDGYTLYEYDDTGRWEKTSSYGADGKLYYANIMEISEDWTYQKTTMLQYDDGELRDYQVVEWEHGRVIRNASYDADGTMTSYSTSEYDEAGNLIKETRYSAEGSLRSYSVYRYDENGNYLGCDYYDKDGNLIQSTMVE